MDRMVQTALNSMKMLMENQAATAHNLSNVSTPGFKQDIITDFSSIYLNRQEGLEPRIVSSREVGKFSLEVGMLDTTKAPLDVAINNEGYFVIQPKNGPPALSRRGDFEVSDEGELTDGAGSKILDANLTPINIPPHKKIVVSENGDLFIEPLGEPEGTRVLAATIALTSGSEEPLHKDTDGQIRLIEGGIPEADQNVVLAQGFIENSNVNAIEELVDTLGQQRLFEINVKFIALSEQIDEGGASIMRLPN